MSQAPVGESVSSEPNLVPLLDLVFQLIMFFMICVNFVSGQVDEEITLPDAQSARPLDKAEVEVLVLNLDSQGHVNVLGQPRPLVKTGDKITFLRQYYSDAMQTAEMKGDKSKKVRTTVIIRADVNSTYEKVFELLRLCKEAKFKKIQLRAKTRTGAG